MALVSKPEGEGFFSKLLSSYLAGKQQPRKIGVYYPSRLPYCLRQQYFEWLYGAEYPLDYLKIFEVGNIFHSWIKDVFLNANQSEVTLLNNEKSFSIYISAGDYFINGRVDDVIYVKTNNELYLVEVKTHRNLKFLDKPHKEHLMQLNFYLKFYPNAKGLILYIEKNTLTIKEFEVFFNQDLFNEMLMRADKLNNALKSLKPPPQEKSPLCQYCLYQRKCKKFLK